MISPFSIRLMAAMYSTKSMYPSCRQGQNHHEDVGLVCLIIYFMFSGILTNYLKFDNNDDNNSEDDKDVRNKPQQPYCFVNESHSGILSLIDMLVKFFAGLFILGLLKLGQKFKGKFLLEHGIKCMTRARTELPQPIGFPFPILLTVLECSRSFPK